MNALENLQSQLPPPAKIALKLDGLIRAPWPPEAERQRDFRYYIIADTFATFLDVREEPIISYCLGIHTPKMPAGGLFDFNLCGRLSPNVVNEFKAGCEGSSELVEVLLRINPAMEVSPVRFKAFVQVLHGRRVNS